MAVDVAFARPTWWRSEATPRRAPHGVTAIRWARAGAQAEELLRATEARRSHRGGRERVTLRLKGADKPQGRRHKMASTLARTTRSATGEKSIAAEAALDGYVVRTSLPAGELAPSAYNA